MASAAAIVATSSLLFGLAPLALVAFVAAFALGIGSTWTLTGSMAFFARAPRVRRGVSMSFFAAALLVGQAVGPAVQTLVPIVADEEIGLGSATVGLALGVGGIARLVGAVLFLPETLPRAAPSGDWRAG